MLKIIVFGLVILSNIALAHMDECVVCAGHTKYEFRGSWKELREQENFWRNEESVCENQMIAKLKAQQPKTSPRCDAEPIEDADQKPIKILIAKAPKMGALHVLRRRLSNRR